MRDIILKRNELLKNQLRLKELKFEPTVKGEALKIMIDEQKELYKRLKFYDNYIKIGGKIYGEQIHTKER